MKPWKKINYTKGYKKIRMKIKKKNQGKQRFLIGGLN
jgi:hypothetical protein